MCRGSPALESHQLTSGTFLTGYVAYKIKIAYIILRNVSKNLKLMMLIDCLLQTDNGGRPKSILDIILTAYIAYTMRLFA